MIGDNMIDILMNALNDMYIICKDGEGRLLKSNDYTISFIDSLDSQLDQFLKTCETMENEAWHVQNPIRSEISVQMSDDSTIYLDMSFTPIFNDDGSRQAIIVSGRDITSQKYIQRHNEFLEYYDPLTNLPNRKLFEEELAKAIVVARVLQQKIIVMVMDLDRFKMINDSLGTGTGNQLLQQFSERLQQLKRENYLFARLGDDEFALLIQNRGLEGSEQIAQEIIDVVKEPYHIDDYQLFITTSIGICEFPPDGEEVSQLYKNASIALGYAKSLGKSRYQSYKNTMKMATIKNFSLKNDLHKALQSDKIDVLYLPKVDLDTNEVVGTKAIICWEHPEWGLVTHKELFALSEETGISIALGDWLKKKICQQLANWDRSGLNPVPIAVNISTARILQKGFIQKLKHILFETDVAPHLFEIEITESSIGDQEESIYDILQQLREMGITVTLDDVGVDSSTLSELAKLPIDNIKIDRSLIQGIGIQPLNDIVVRGIIEQVKNAKLIVIAEGIDRVEQLHFLRENNCDHIQGFRYNKPAKANDYEEILKIRRIVLPQHDAKSNYENMRKFFRINLTYPLAAEMTIIRFKDKNVSLGKTEVLIKDLGLGGVRFASDIQLAVHPDIILRLETEILGELITLLGYIVWKKEKNHGIYEYGLEFIIDERERDTLAMSLNLFSARIRQNPVLPDCRFITINSRLFFEKKAQEEQNQINIKAIR